MPKTRDVVVTVRFTDKEAQALRQVAHVEGLSMSALVRRSTLGAVFAKAGGAPVQSSSTLTVSFTGGSVGDQPRGEFGQPIAGSIAVPVN